MQPFLIKKKDIFELSDAGYWLEGAMGEFTLDDLYSELLRRGMMDFKAELLLKSFEKYILTKTFPDDDDTEYCVRNEDGSITVKCFTGLYII